MGSCDITSSTTCIASCLPRPDSGAREKSGGSHVTTMTWQTSILSEMEAIFKISPVSFCAGDYCSQLEGPPPCSLGPTGDSPSPREALQAKTKPSEQQIFFSNSCRLFPSELLKNVAVDAERKSGRK